YAHRFSAQFRVYLLLAGSEKTVHVYKQKTRFGRALHEYLQWDKITSTGLQLHHQLAGKFQRVNQQLFVFFVWRKIKLSLSSHPLLGS
ncbi:MAG TPA: hypothetical protein VK202_06895, partial [Bacteroidia bacterium]|nr:hypothetical protein [Bacteroidia bacterium]